MINPDIASLGIVRVCSTHNPGEGTDTGYNSNLSRWKKVGTCDERKMGCWLDTQSVKDVITSTTIESNILSEATEKYMDVLKTAEYYDFGDRVDWDGFLGELKGGKSDAKIRKIDDEMISINGFINSSSLLISS